jgi:hypothetical protein
MTAMPCGFTLALSRHVGQVLYTLHVASTLVNVWGKMIAGEIAVCGMLLDVITQSDNHLRGQVRTGRLCKYLARSSAGASPIPISDRYRPEADIVCVPYEVTTLPRQTARPQPAPLGPTSR